MIEKVEKGKECPRCGEDEQDLLEWLNDTDVLCQSCQTTYNPETGEILDSSAFDDPADPGDMDGDFDSGMRDAGFGTDESYGSGASDIL